MISKMTKRGLQAQNTRERIYRTAVELMEKKGLSNITIEEICKRANVSVGSFYNCFKSKNDILNEIYNVADDYFLNVVAKDLTNGNTHDKIIRFFHHYADYNVNRGIDFVVHLYNPQNTMFIKKGRHMQLVLQNVIEEGQKIGEITTEKTAEEIVRFLFIAIRGVIYDWCLYKGQYNLVEFVDDYVSSLVKVLN